MKFIVAWLICKLCWLLAWLSTDDTEYTITISKKTVEPDKSIKPVRVGKGGA